MSATIIQFPNRAPAPVFQPTRHDENTWKLAELVQARAIRHGKPCTFDEALIAVRGAFARTDRERQL